MQQVTDITFNDSGRPTATTEDLPNRQVNFLALDDKQFWEEIRIIRQEERDRKLRRMFEPQTSIWDMIGGER